MIKVTVEILPGGYAEYRRRHACRDPARTRGRRPSPARRSLYSRDRPARSDRAIASLACEGVVHLDLSSGFGPHTVVRSGS
jgi:hypothetical protein